jgi:hypothetical protein
MGNNPDMYHHSLVLITHLGPARPFAAAAIAAAAALGGLAVNRIRRARHHA